MVYYEVSTGLFGRRRLRGLPCLVDDAGVGWDDPIGRLCGGQRGKRVPLQLYLCHAGVRLRRVVNSQPNGQSSAFHLNKTAQ
eukprot:6479308-Pyramimonas_sp.AAC.2